jgi:hypothetical protein
LVVWLQENEFLDMERFEEGSEIFWNLWVLLMNGDDESDMNVNRLRFLGFLGTFYKVVVLLMMKILKKMMEGQGRR